MDYIIKRSKRKTLAVSVKDAKVVVHAPKTVSDREIQRFIFSKEKWINKHISTQEDLVNRKRGFRLEYGSNILYRGRSLIICGSNIKGYIIEDNKLVIPEYKKQDEIKQIIKSVYRNEAKRIINEKVHYYSERMEVNPAGVRITGARTRWGSCSSKGNLNFSWFLMMAGDDEMDYVIVHELAHLKQMNHSPKFWNIVEKYMPDRKNLRKELRALNQRLQTEDWD